MLQHSKNSSNIYVVLILIGFFALGLLTNVIPGGSRVVTIPYRALVLIISLFLIGRGLLKNSSLLPARKIVFFFLFWALYLVRLISDLYFRNVQATVFENNFDYLLNAVGICIIPALSMLYLKEINFDRVLKWLFRILLVSLTISLFLNLNLDRDELNSYGRYSGGKGLSIISYGHQGVTLALLSLFLISRAHTTRKIIFYILSFLLGLFVMYLAGSKSPLLALILCASFYFFSSKGLIKGLIIICIIVFPFFILGDELMDFLSRYGGTFVERIVRLLEGGDEGRNFLFAEGFTEFTNAPVLGNSFVLQDQSSRQWNGFYPHNIIIESMMAMGLIGGLIIILLLFSGIRAAYKLSVSLKPNAWVGLLFIQYAILAMFSNAIYTNHFFWYYYILLMAAYYNSNQQTNLKQT